VARFLLRHDVHPLHTDGETSTYTLVPRRAMHGCGAKKQKTTKPPSIKDLHCYFFKVIIKRILSKGVCHYFTVVIYSLF